MGEIFEDLSRSIGMDRLIRVYGFEYMVRVGLDAETAIHRMLPNEKNRREHFRIPAIRGELGCGSILSAPVMPNDPGKPGLSGAIWPRSQGQAGPGQSRVTAAV